MWAVLGTERTNMRIKAGPLFKALLNTIVVAQPKWRTRHYDAPEPFDRDIKVVATFSRDGEGWALRGKDPAAVTFNCALTDDMGTWTRDQLAPPPTLLASSCHDPYH